MSEIHAVQAKAREYGLAVYRSSRKDKKFMIFLDGKRIHFGDAAYEDFTSHRDEARRARFQKRNARWAAAPQFTPAWLSYHWLW